MFILLSSPHSFLLIELLTTSLILISFVLFFYSRIVTEKLHQGSVNKLLYCIVLPINRQLKLTVVGGGTGTEKRCSHNLQNVQATLTATV